MTVGKKEQGPLVKIPDGLTLKQMGEIVARESAKAGKTIQVEINGGSFPVHARVTVDQACGEIKSHILEHEQQQRTQKERKGGGLGNITAVIPYGGRMIIFRQRIWYPILPDEKLEKRIKDMIVRSGAYIHVNHKSISLHARQWGEVIACKQMDRYLFLKVAPGEWSHTYLFQNSMGIARIERALLNKWASTAEDVKKNLILDRVYAVTQSSYFIRVWKQGVVVAVIPL